MAARRSLSPALVPTLRSRADLVVPGESLLGLPERAVQFGTGAFLRGFVDSFLDTANRAGVFGGRVVMIGSTGSGRDRALNEQHGLYTLVVQGLVDGAPRRELRIVSSVSRALAAPTQWAEVLRCAENPDLEVIFSNTTEIGIALDEGDAESPPGVSAPNSFPGKLAAFLLHRARSCAFDARRAPIVLPCELIESNGDRLKAIVTTLATRWHAEPAFFGWLDAVPFCNTLVDRIVQGAPGPTQAPELAQALGYDDGMTTVCEPYRLFAIEGDATVRARLRFAAADDGIVVADSVTPYRLRKVRLLNGAHTTFVSLAILAGCTTVRESMEHPALGSFLRTALTTEIVPSVDVPGAAEFARDVLDRFANPYLQHLLWDITLQGTMKFRVRVVPSILGYAERHGHAPRALALGLAGFLAFQDGSLQAARREAGSSVPADAGGETLRARWQGVDRDGSGLAAFVHEVLADAEIWGTDLTSVPRLSELVTDSLHRIRSDGAVAAIESLGFERVR